MAILFAGSTLAEFASQGANTAPYTNAAIIGPYVSEGIEKTSGTDPGPTAELNSAAGEVGVTFYVYYTGLAASMVNFIEFLTDGNASLGRFVSNRSNTSELRNGANTLLLSSSEFIPSLTLVRIDVHAKFGAAGFFKVWKDTALLHDYSGDMTVGTCKKIKFEFNLATTSRMSAVVVLDGIPTGVHLVHDQTRTVDENTFATSGGTGATGVLANSGGMNDANFVSADAVGQKFGYSSALLAKPAGHEVLGVNVSARVTSLSGDSARVYGKISGTDYDQSVQAVGASYGVLNQVFANDPSTAAPFATLDAAEAMIVGLKAA